MALVSAERNDSVDVRSRGRGLSVICVAVYLAGVLLLLASLLKHTHGRLVYALDDPYIHLALAEQMAHGTYGINAGQASSPSSSLLWPILLVPFSGTHVQVVLPLFWNVVFSMGTAWLIGLCVTRWSGLRPTDSLLGQGSHGWTKRVLVAVLLLFVANLWTLTFVGMEHGLQIFLAVLCAFGVTEVFSGRPMSSGVLVAAAILPSVRYEGLGLTLAVALALYGERKRWVAPVLLVVVSLLPLLAFSMFLHAHGMPLLPNSLLVKSQVATQRSGTLAHTLWIIFVNVRSIAPNIERWPVTILTLMLAHLWWRESNDRRRWVLGGATLALGLHVLLGQNGWFTRYEVYAVVFGTILVVRILAERPPFLFSYFAVGLLFFGAPYVVSTQQIVNASMDIYRQQYQMHRFLQEFYHGNVAVNDLGLVAYQKPPGTYVLDLWGLASTEAAKQRNKNGAWMESITQRNDVALAMVYPSWYASIPESWAPLGSMCVETPLTFLNEHCVVFYSTEMTRRAELAADVASFVKTLPSKVTFYPGVARVWMPN